MSTLKGPGGVTQVKYNGKPLYLFASEGIAAQNSSYAATGSGSGIKAGGGTFELVKP